MKLALCEAGIANCLAKRQSYPGQPDPTPQPTKSDRHHTKCPAYGEQGAKQGTAASAAAFCRNARILLMMLQRSRPAASSMMNDLIWKGITRMTTLILLSLMGLLAGAVAGLAAYGLEGLVLGASTGLVLGVTVWAVFSMSVQWRRERRLDSYFSQSTGERER